MVVVTEEAVLEADSEETDSEEAEGGRRVMFASNYLYLS